MTDDKDQVILEAHDEQPAEEDVSPAGQAEAENLSDDLEILREEIARQQIELDAVRAEAEQGKLRHLAEMQTLRRRLQQDIERAHDKGRDSVILSVLPVYDDLRRALEVAGDDPAKIIPGIEQVRETLRRNLETIGLVEVGQVGEDFNPEFHEALTSMPATSEAQKGKIAQVFESGFMKDERVVRVARVVVYQ